MQFHLFFVRLRRLFSAPLTGYYQRTNDSSVCHEALLSSAATYSVT